MLAGYTAAIIGFPSVAAPGAIFTTALARVEEITLGLALHHAGRQRGVPRPVGPVLTARLAAWLANANAWSQDALAGRSADPERRRLAADAVEIDMLSSQLAYDPSTTQRAIRPLRALRERMVMLLPVLSSIADRVAALERSGGMTPALRGLLEQAALWLRGAPQPGLRRAVADALRPAASRSDWNAIMRNSLLMRLGELIDIRTDAQALQAQIAAGEPRLPALAFPDSGVAALARHRDPAMALLSAFSATLAVALICVFWIAASWPEGAIAAEMAAVACCFFAAQDDPVPAILNFLAFSVVAVLVDAAYLFAILPQVHGFAMLALALAPAFILFGLLTALPRTASIGMALGANGATLMSLQSTYSADFAAFANSGIALVVGMGVAAMMTRIVRSVGAEWSARRLLQAGWAEIAAAASRGGAAERPRFAGLMLDRLGLLMPRLAIAEQGADLAAANALADLRIGLNVVDLQRDDIGLPADAREAVAAALDALAAHFRAQAARRASLPPADGLRRAIDAAIGVVAGAPPNGQRRNVLLELVGIRRGLFPDAPPYAPPPARDAPVQEAA